MMEFHNINSDAEDLFENSDQWLHDIHFNIINFQTWTIWR